MRKGAGRAGVEKVRRGQTNTESSYGVCKL